MRLGNVTARALITGMRIFRNILGEAFIEPAGDAVGVKAVQDKMNNLVTEKIVAEFVSRIPLNKETAGGMNSTRPFFQVSEGLKLLPVFRLLKNINVRFDVAGRLLALQFLRDHAIMKLRFD